MDETDVRYATGLVAPDPFLLLLVGNRRHLVVSALEAARARRACPGAQVHTPATLFGEGGPRRRSLGAQAIALMKKLGLRTVAAGPWFPLGIARALQSAGVRVLLVRTPPFPQRAVKTPREIACIAKSQRAAVAAMRTAVRTLRTAAISRTGLLRHAGRPLTSERLRELIEQTLLERGCSAAGTIVAVGAQGARPHDVGSGPLRAGAPIVIDIFPRDKTTGYWGDLTRTVVRGPAAAEFRRLHRTVRTAQQLAFSMLRPGTEARAVQHAVEEHFRRAGFITQLSPPGRERGFIHSLGHGVGLDIHESPGLRHEPGRLAAGNVITVEPGLYLPGRGGVRIEDTVVITRTGYKILASFPRKLET